jgi:sporadic carbohydrate cluster protein (TIGR04323 family)
MSKYNIEGGIDFFAELYKSLDIEENGEKTEEDNNVCLITNQPLEDKFVQLICGHKFNYKPLYIDIKNHKQKFNNYEGHTSKLKLNEIRCPYCRTKQNTVLPYYEELGLKKINGVNMFDPSLILKYYNSNNYIYPKCCYLIPNPKYNIIDGSSNVVVDASNNINSSSPNSNNNKFKFLLSAAEYSMKGSYFVLKDIIKELSVISGVVAFSIFQLPDNKNKRIDLLKTFIKKKKSIHFALERFSVKSNNDIVKLNQIWQIKKTVNSKNKRPWIKK